MILLNVSLGNLIKTMQQRLRLQEDHWRMHTDLLKNAGDNISKLCLGSSNQLNNWLRVHFQLICKRERAVGNQRLKRMQASEQIKPFVTLDIAYEEVVHLIQDLVLNH